MLRELQRLERTLTHVGEKGPLVEALGLGQKFQPLQLLCGPSA